MNKDWVKVIVRNFVHEVSKDLNIDIQVNDIKDFETDTKVEFEIFGSDLVTRSLHVHHHGNGYSISHGIHSPSHGTSDLIQSIVVGRVAQRLLEKNSK
jgi:hypothetical protein